MVARHRKKTKFREVSFKLTDRQKKALDEYCGANKSTPIKVIKGSIRKIIDGEYSSMLKDNINPNQIDLEDLIRELVIDEDTVEETDTTPQEQEKEISDFPKDLFSY